MKEQGVPEDDPEFKRCRQFLAMVTQQTQLKRLKIAQQQQQQEAMARQRQVQQQSMNGINGELPRHSPI